MAHIDLPEGLPGIRGPLAFREQIHGKVKRCGRRRQRQPEKKDSGRQARNLVRRCPRDGHAG